MNLNCCQKYNIEAMALKVNTQVSSSWKWPLIKKKKKRKVSMNIKG